MPDHFRLPLRRRPRFITSPAGAVALFGAGAAAANLVFALASGRWIEAAAMGMVTGFLGSLALIEHLAHGGER